MKRALSLFFLLAYSSNLLANTLNQGDLEIKLPPAWSCSPGHAHWRCTSVIPGHEDDALIVLVAKEKSANDSLDAYLARLKKRMPESAIQYIKTTKLSGQDWADSLMRDSELPGYTTRYLATTKDQRALMITYSIKNPLLSSLKGELDMTLLSTKLLATQSPPPVKPEAVTPNKPELKLNYATDTKTIDPTGAIDPTPMPKSQEPQPQSAPASSPLDLTLYIAAGVLILGTLLFKKLKR